MQISMRMNLYIYDSLEASNNLEITILNLDGHEQNQPDLALKVSRIDQWLN